MSYNSYTVYDINGKSNDLLFLCHLSWVALLSHSCRVVG